MPPVLFAPPAFSSSWTSNKSVLSFAALVAVFAASIPKEVSLDDVDPENHVVELGPFVSFALFLLVCAIRTFGTSLVRVCARARPAPPPRASFHSPPML